MEISPRSPMQPGSCATDSPPGAFALDRKDAIGGMDGDEPDAADAGAHGFGGGGRIASHISLAEPYRRRAPAASAGEGRSGSSGASIRGREFANSLGTGSTRGPNCKRALAMRAWARPIRVRRLIT
eukprot:scaffold56557_cov27-Tisochrysis_lutea.AAC.4